MLLVFTNTELQRWNFLNQSAEKTAEQDAPYGVKGTQSDKVR